MTIFNRQPKGIPVGGQFTAGTHAEPALALTVDAPKIGTRDTADMFGAARDMVCDALQTHRDRIEGRRTAGSQRARINPNKRRLAVAALVLAASMSLTACTGQGDDCPKAADFPTSSQSASDSGVSADDAQASLPMRGGGGGHGGGGHGTSGHAAEGGTTGHTTEGDSTGGGSSGSSGPHFWPWSTGGHSSSQCTAHPTTTPTP